MLFSCAASFSQIDTGKRTFVVPIPETPLPAPQPEPNVNEDPFAVIPIKRVTPLPEAAIEEAPEISMYIKPNELMNPGVVMKEKLSKGLQKSLVNQGLKEDTSYLIVKDVNFGDIRTQSPYFIVQCRDYGAIDGDLIKATLNQNVVVSRLEVAYEFKQFKIDLNIGINQLELEALNKGALGGNTAEFRIFDYKGNLIMTDIWENWDAGVKGKFVIIRE